MRRLTDHRLTLAALLLTVAIGAVFAHAIWSARAARWADAARAQNNLAHTLQQHVGRTIDNLDQSLRGVVDQLARPEVLALPADLRDRVLFDHSLRQAGISGVGVLDLHGNLLMSTQLPIGNGPPPNMAERDYFHAFHGGQHQGLYISAPLKAPVSGSYNVVFARPWNDSEGRFAGVVAGALRVEYFEDLFSSLDLGEGGSVRLLRADGQVLARFPFAEAATAEPDPRSPSLGDGLRRGGNYVAPADGRGGERLVSHFVVAQYPLVIDVAEPVATVLAPWWRNAIVLAVSGLSLMAGCVALAWLFSRELARRQQIGSQLVRAEHDMRTLLDSLPSLAGYWDTQLRCRLANQTYRDWFGLAPVPRHAEGTPVREVVGDPLFSEIRPYLDRVLRGEPQRFEHALIGHDGVQRHTMAILTPDLDAQGQVLGFFAQVTDITDRKRMEDQLFEDKELVRLTLLAIGDAVVCVDPQGHVTYFNPAAERLTGWQAFEAAARPVAEVLQLEEGNEGAEAGHVLMRVLGGGGMIEAQRALLVHRLRARQFRIDVTASPIMDRQGHVTGAVAVLRDVTEQMAMAARMEHLAQFDPLTDLPNRVLLQDRARLAIAQCRRNASTLAVVYIDLDGFKAVNDSLGHECGDELLVQVAQRLLAVVRETDTVCRQGGDEFVLLMPGLEGDGEAQVARIAGKLLDTIRAPFLLRGQTVHVGMSGGIALCPAHGDSLNVLARNADAAMYAAKRAGRMQLRLFRGDDQPPLCVAGGQGAEHLAK